MSTDNEVVSIQGLAAECLAEANDDIVAACELMEKRVRGNNALFSALMSPLVAQACYDAVRMQLRANRKVVWTAPNYTKGGNGHRLFDLAKSLMELDAQKTQKSGSRERVKK